MRVKLNIIFLIFFISLLNLSAEELTLDMLISSLDNNIHLTKADALSEMGYYDYKEARASLYPSITGSIPFFISNTETNNYPVMGFENQKDKIITIEPGITINQLLPSAGSLTAEISDTVTMDYSASPEWKNTVGISMNFLQPVFFKGAFDATLEIINKTYENNNLTVFTEKNAMVLKAVESYYTLKQAIFNLELIQIRFIRDQENYKRINQEFEMGLWTKSELYQAKSILIKSETDLLEAQQIMSAARQSIINNFSLPNTFYVSSNVDSIDFGEIDYPSILKEVMSNNSSATQAKNMYTMQKASLTILRKDSGPELSLGGSYSYLIDMDNSDINSNSLSLSVGLSGNFFDGGKETAKMKSGKALLNQLQSDYSLLVLEMEQQIITIIDSISRYDKLTELYTFQEEAAQYELEKGKKDLELGQITDKDFSELQINLEDIKLSKQQNIINTNMLYLQLADLQGIDLLNDPLVRNKE